MSRVPAIGRSLAGWRRRFGIAAVELFGEVAEALQRLGLEPAIGQFLDAVGEPALQEAPVVGRRLGLEELAATAASELGCRHAAFRAATRASTVSVIVGLSQRRGVGMTALVGREVERTLSAVRQIKVWTFGPAAA